MPLDERRGDDEQIRFFNSSGKIDADAQGLRQRETGKETAVFARFQHAPGDVRFAQGERVLAFDIVIGPVSRARLVWARVAQAVEHRLFFLGR